MSAIDLKTLREDFEILVDRLDDCQVIYIEESLDPSFLEVDNCQRPVSVQGRAYLAGDKLIVHLNAETGVYLPCSICNENIEKIYAIEELCLVEDLSSINSKKYSFKEPLREALLLAMPVFVECNEGNCPQRIEIERFLNKSKKEIQGNNPFIDL